MALQEITQGITGQEAAAIILQNDRDILGSTGYPFQNVNNYDLFPVKKIRFYGSPVEGQSIFLHYFFNRESVSGGRRSNLQFDVLNSAGTLLYSVVASGWESVVSTDTKGLISGQLIILKPGDPLHGKVVGEYTIDADLATYRRENGYGVYNTDDNQYGYNLSPLCWDNIATSGIGDHTAVSLKAFNEIISVFIKDSNGITDWMRVAVQDVREVTGNYEKFMQNEYWIAYLWKNLNVNGTLYNLIRFGESSPQSTTDNYAMLQWTGKQTDTVESYSIKDISITIDWAKVPDGTSWNGKALFRKVFTGVTQIQIPEGYGERDTTAQLITVKKDGTGNFTTIGDAYASIKDSSYENQYEVCVYPGVYEEHNLKPPKYTHTHGLAPNTVTITSKPWNAESTLPVFDQQYASSKLSNMTIDSWTGYCIHYDVALDRCTLVNENLHLIKRYYSGALMAVIGGGSFKYGTKFHWKGCTFEGVGATCEASCHTNGNVLNENIHQVFDNCVFVNGYPNIGSVGGFGHCVCEIRGCRFTPGVRGLFTWNSPIRNIEDPTLYLYNTIEWQVIGGGNNNFAPLLYSRGKTIQLEAATPIEISGNAAAVIFGDIPAIEAPGVRYPATLTSMYYIADEKAGMEGYSELRDVFQLWKRLGDCTTQNKTLTVTVNGVTRSHVFKDNYLQTKESQNSIIAKMNTSLTNVTVKAITASGYNYDNINTTDKMYVTVTAADILKGEVVTLSGAKAVDTTPLNDILGFATKNAVQGESVPVWVNAFAPDGGIADGQYGLDANGTLSASAATKIGYAKGNIFYMYR